MEIWIASQIWTFSNCGWCHCEELCTTFCLNTCFQFFGGTFLGVGWQGQLVILGLIWGLPCSLVSKEYAHNAGDLSSIPGSERSPGEGSHSSVLAWRIPWTEDPGEIQSMGVTKSWTRGLIYWGKTPDNFPQLLHYFTFSTAIYEDSHNHILTNTCYFPLFYILVILVSVTWYHIVALTCISLTINDVGYISMCLVLCHAQLLQSYLTFWDSQELNLPGSSVHGIFQARTLEWLAMPSSRDHTCVSCIGMWILYCWATEEALLVSKIALLRRSLKKKEITYKCNTFRYKVKFLLI